MGYADDHAHSGSGQSGFGGGGTSSPGGDGGKKDWSRANAEARAREKAQKTAKATNKTIVKEKKTEWKPTPAIEDLEYYDPSLDWRQNVDRYRQVEKIGKYAGLPESQLGFHELRNRSKMKPAAAKAYSQKIASINHPMLSRAYGFFSRLAPGIVTSKLTYNAKGKLAEYSEFDGIGLVTDILGVGLNPGVRGIPKQLYGALNAAGVYGPLHSSTRSLSETMAQSAQTMRQQQSQKNSARNSSVENKQSVFDRASQQLYPAALEDENAPVFAVGTSFGKSKVRKAPNLSALKAKRTNFGRVR